MGQEDIQSMYVLHEVNDALQKTINLFLLTLPYFIIWHTSNSTEYCLHLMGKLVASHNSAKIGNLGPVARKPHFRYPLDGEFFECLKNPSKWKNIRFDFEQTLN